MHNRYSGTAFFAVSLALSLFFVLFASIKTYAADAPVEPLAAAMEAEREKKAADDVKQDDDDDSDNDDQDVVSNAWGAIWSGQHEAINEIRETAIKLGDNFAEQTAMVANQMKPYDEEGRRLLVFVNTFKGHPNAMEAVNHRLDKTIEDINSILEPVTQAQVEAKGLLERINYMSESLPDDVDHIHLSPEMQSYIHDIRRARLRLTAVLTQYNSLLPSLSLVKKLKTAQAEVSASLPTLWKNFYLQKPVPWLNSEVWINAGRDLHYSWQAMLLRLPVELPTTLEQWGTALLRLCIGLIFLSILAYIVKKNFLPEDAPLAARRIFTVAIPWLIAGFSCLGGAQSAKGDFYRLFLATGSLLIITGETYLAWELRLISAQAKKVTSPPFLRLLLLAVYAYVLLYLPLTRPITLLAWTLMLIVALIRNKKFRKTMTSSMPFENGIMECNTVILWPCLFLAISGLHIYSMALYLAYVSLAIGTEFSLGGMSMVNKINDHLPHEGARAVLARLAVALAAPFVLVVAVVGVCFWILVLPGGIYLVSEYALKEVSVGASQFNIVKILLIISIFYLTRTVVAMGTRFLAKLPKQEGVRFDSTLVTPMQTALTYAAWAIFGLFVLRSLGMELSNLAMVAGGLSVGIGFGMQTIVNNFLSGLILIFGRTLQVGDVVDVAGTTGRVRKISVRATMVETYDNAIIYVPNSEFMAGRLINWTSLSRSVRHEVQVGVAYGSNTETVIKLLINIAKEHANVLKYPTPSVNFADFGASSLDFRLRFWVKDYELAVVTSSDIRLAINRVFAEHNIEISFPQLDVHIKEEPKNEEASAMPEKVSSAPARVPRRLPPYHGRRRIPLAIRKKPGKAASGA